VTIEDLLEEIVGEIQDETDVELPMVEVISPSEVHVDARVSLDDINDLLKTDWEAEDSDTIGGFVYEQLGRIPNPGDSVQIGHFTITVLSTEGARIKQLSIVHQLPPEEAGQAPQDNFDPTSVAS
jgi:CBS domain containing-hemolysin-like protein